MLIPFKAIYTLFERHFVPRSINGIIEECKNTFGESLSTAESLEDYLFLDQMVTKRILNETRYCYFWDYRHHTPTVLERDTPVTLFALASFCFDHSKIDIREWEDLIISVAENSGFSTEEKLQKFRSYINAIKGAYNLEFKKIHRNDLCPCGSGKKYKKCHGLNE